MVRSNGLNSRLISQRRERGGTRVMPTPRFDQEGGGSSSDVQIIEVNLGEVLKVVAKTAPEKIIENYGVGERELTKPRRER